MRREAIPHFLCEVAEAVVDAGATTVNLPDTVGYALPQDITRMFRTVARSRRQPRHPVGALSRRPGTGRRELDRGSEAGARQVECTINGIGERAGNASLEEFVMALHVRRDRLPFSTAVRTTELCTTSRMLSDTVPSRSRRTRPSSGANAFAHEAGIHQDGVLKNPLTYEIIRPEIVGAAGTRLVLGKHSGTRGVDARCRALGFTLRPDALARVYARLVATADRSRPSTTATLSRR